MFPRRLALPLLVAVAAVLALPAASPAATGPYPTIRSVAPKKLAVGETLTLKGRNYRKGKRRNTVVFKRDGGRAVFVRVPKATQTRIRVVVPAKLLPFFRQKAGKPRPTRFRLRVLATRFGKRFTADALTPLISPSGPTGRSTASDCDGDGVPNSAEGDDDNDLIPDSVEQAIGTASCKADSDGDGMTDGWEYYSSLDLNGSALPSPNARPYPNALNGKDGGLDQDGDALTNAEEYAAWATYGGHRLPLSYSGGTAMSAGRTPVPADQAYMDRDGNGYLTDNERDADGDGLANQDEGMLTRPVNVAKGKTPQVGFFDPAYIGNADVAAVINVIPLYGALPYTQKAEPTDWLSADTDGDGVRDGSDDQDHDGVANIDELKAELAAPADKEQQLPLNACAPNLDSRACTLSNLDADRDGIPNGVDPDDDNDNLPDTLEISLGLRPDVADTDGDGVTDGFEYSSAMDLNRLDLPYPGKRPYPNALDGSDAGQDFDQDGLTMKEEYRAWVVSGRPTPYNYSDGTRWSVGNRPDPAYADDNRDVDGDGLANFDETHGAMRVDWWTSVFDGSAPSRPKESKYPGPDYLEPDFTVFDSDGDGVGDGADDQDHDGYPNWFEVETGAGFQSPGRVLGWQTAWDSTDPLARRQPYNPCKPIYSYSCHPHPPLAYYPPDEAWASPFGPEDPGTDPPSGPPPTLVR